MTISTPVNIIGDVFPINSGSDTTTGTLKSGSSTTNAVIPANALFFMSIAATGTSDSFTNVKDSAGNNSYNLIQTSDVSNGSQAIAWLIPAAAIPQGTKITATTSDGSTWGLGTGYYVTGASNGLDKQNSLNNDGSNNVTSISLSTGALAVASEIVVGVFNTNGNGVTWTEASGFTTLHNDNFSLTSYEIVSTASSVTWNPSFTATGPLNAVLASFEASSIVPEPQFAASAGIVQVVAGIAF